ncbi:glycerol-3-phosphate dehydrogenase [Moniliophthora roreri MCA 2997]|uniref:Glycerol-3-phosphate dehydrogenase [NAD(+)] n=1 Tax=Moniliophthora roreri (strain MCA 2997) TaxID=1381753 RepID=V2X0C2_MONRO|nr:glycerol-3-phosphate dehydrogenase [Moniliophthora roreri MCA 2997]
MSATKVPTPPASPSPEPASSSPVESSFNASSLPTPDNSRPPSPLLRPLPTSSRPANSHGLPSKPSHPLTNALSGASMSFTAISNAAKRKNQLPPSPPRTASPTPPRASSPENLPSDDEDERSTSSHDAISTSVPRPPPARRTSSVAMEPYITKFDPYQPEEYVVDPKSGSRSPARLEKVAIVGSGSWGTALARVAAINVAEREGFDPEVRMWVREREIPGRGLLTEIINTTHQNERYLPSVDLPENLVAVSDVKDVVRGATLLLFVVPHQFLPSVLSQLEQPGIVNPRARAISAIKGVDVRIREDGTADIYTYPFVIEEALDIPCSALGGANIALDVGKGEFCETTIGVPGPKDAALWHAVFDGPAFRVHPIEDVAGVSLSGALKNVVAMAAGFVDGMGLGGNTKAAILRIGLLEMSTFTLEFFPSSSPLTFSHHSAGVADLITTSFGGRNRKCAEAFVKSRKEYGGEGEGKTFEQLEKELLNGQKLQGVATAQEVFEFLKARNRLEAYPLFEKVYRISFENMDPRRLFEDL